MTTEALESAAPADAPAHPPGLSAAPYPGLRPFRQDESDIFFGREAQTDQLLTKLRRSRFLAVVGPSGCGKSSLVRAGMIAALESGFLADAGSRWRFAEMRPGGQPLARLARALLAAGAPAGHPARAEPEAAAWLEALLRRGPLGMAEALREIPLPPGTNLLLLVDQFEEIFRFRREGSPDEADAFVALLLATALRVDVPVYVVLTMRSDYLGDCALFTGLPEAMNESQFLTPRMTRSQTEAAITGPARVFDGRVEPALVNLLLNAMGTDPDQLPVLQHLLMRMWARPRSAGERGAHGGGIVLTPADYAAVGGFSDALSRHADAALEELSAGERRIAQILFRALTEREAGNRDTRRPTPLGRVADIAEVEWEEVAHVVDVFRRPDRSFLTPAAGEPLDRGTVLDISHETLIRQWKTLAGWVQAEAESATMYRRLLQDARLHRIKEVGLWRPPALHLALKWKDDQHPTAPWAARYAGDGDGNDDFALVTEFLQASRDEWEVEERARAEREQRERERELLEAQRALRESERERELERQRAVARDAIAAAHEHRSKQRQRYLVVVSITAAALLMLNLIAYRARRDAERSQDQAIAALDSVKKLRVSNDSLLELYRKTQLLTQGISDERPQVTGRDTAGQETGADSVDTGSAGEAPWMEKRWPAGSTLRVRFLDGDPALHAKVERYAREWVGNTGLRLAFDGGADAPIRISFEEPGSWSYLGTDAVNVARNRPTMNLGGLRAASPDEEIAAATLHEFGHVLGLVDEHQNPNARIPWNRQAVYRFYQGAPYQWDRERVNAMLFRRYSGAYRPFDPSSVMLYPIPKELTSGGWETRRNTRLSNGDRALVQCLYPPRGAPSRTVEACLGALTTRP